MGQRKNEDSFYALNPFIFASTGGHTYKKDPCLQKILTLDSSEYCVDALRT